MTADDIDTNMYAMLEGHLGHTFADRALCEAALTHKSWVNEAADATRTDNERLEFLGDAVLALVVSDLLMKRFPDRADDNPGYHCTGRFDDLRIANRSFTAAEIRALANGKR